MKQYLDLLKELLDSGNEKGDRTGTGTLSKFGHQMRFDLQAGFPLVTTKKIHTPSVIHELLWLLSGSTNVKYLNDNGVRIWNDWADKNGYLGPVYGKQWRRWAALSKAEPGSVQYFDSFEIDQIADVIAQIKANPNSRRLIVTAWNPADLDKMALPPCHCFFQFYVHDGKLSCQLYQRSADVFLGVPFNIASYALLTHMIAQQCDLEVGDLVWTGGDVHLYLNHIDQARLQLQREIFRYELPTLLFNRKPESIFDYNFEDFQLVNYLHHPAIKAKVSV